MKNGHNIVKNSFFKKLKTWKILEKRQESDVKNQIVLAIAVPV